eukprot:gene18927-10579_t
MLGFVLTAATASAAATLGPFRAPAIPLFTTDPYMQTWMMGDNTTADTVRHWDQTSKEMFGMVQVGGKTYRFLGACEPPQMPAPTKPGPVEHGSDGYVITGSRPPPPPPPAYCYHEPLSQTSVVVMPTYTEFQLSDAGNTFQLAVKF